VGDRPKDALSVGVPSGWTSATVYLDGSPLDTTLDGTTATATWPGDPFPAAGIYPVTVRVEGEATSQTLTADSIVAEERDDWHTLASARAEWTNSLSDVQLYTVLSVARAQVVTFLGLTEGDPVLLRHRQGQLMQARNVWNAAKTDPAQSADGDLFVIRPYPLDRFIIEVLQPRTVVPAVG
jgi:hypothetical protein